MKIEGKLKLTGRDPKMGILYAEMELGISLRSNKRVEFNVPIGDFLNLQDSGTVVFEIPEKVKFKK